MELCGLPTPRINREIVFAEDGDFVRTDFAFDEYRVLLEYQGDYHRTTMGQWRKDMTRRSRLEAEGWFVMEINADDLKHPDELVARIRSVLRQRGYRGYIDPQTQLPKNRRYFSKFRGGSGQFAENRGGSGQLDAARGCPVPGLPGPAPVPVPAQAPLTRRATADLPKTAAKFRKIGADLGGSARIGRKWATRRGPRMPRPGLPRLSPAPAPAPAPAQAHPRRGAPPPDLPKTAAKFREIGADLGSSARIGAEVGNSSPAHAPGPACHGSAPPPPPPPPRPRRIPDEAHSLLTCPKTAPKFREIRGRSGSSPRVGRKWATRRGPRMPGPACPGQALPRPALPLEPAERHRCNELLLRDREEHDERQRCDHVSRHEQRPVRAPGALEFAMPSCNVNASVLLMAMSGQIRSFHAPSRVKMARVASAGLASGSTILKNTCMRVQPSIALLPRVRPGWTGRTVASGRCRTPSPATARWRHPTY